MNVLWNTWSGIDEPSRRDIHFQFGRAYGDFLGTLARQQMEDSMNHPRTRSRGDDYEHWNEDERYMEYMERDR